MEATVNQTIILTLSLEESKWLKSVVQNPLLDYENEEDEPKQDREMRLKFWDALSGNPL